MALSAADYDEQRHGAVRARARHGHRRRGLLGPVPVPRRRPRAALPRRPRCPPSAGRTWARATWTSPWPSPSTGSTPPAYETLERNLREAASRRRRTRAIRSSAGGGRSRGATSCSSSCATPTRCPRAGTSSRSPAPVRFQAFNVAGVRLLPADHRLVESRPSGLTAGCRGSGSGSPGRCRSSRSRSAPSADRHHDQGRVRPRLHAAQSTPTDRPRPAARSPQAP